MKDNQKSESSKAQHKPTSMMRPCRGSSSDHRGPGRPGRCEPCIGGADCRAGCRVSVRLVRAAPHRTPSRPAAPGPPRRRAVLRPFLAHMLAAANGSAPARVRCVAWAASEAGRGGGPPGRARRVPCPPRGTASAASSPARPSPDHAGQSNRLGSGSPV